MSRWLVLCVVWTLFQDKPPTPVKASFDLTWKAVTDVVKGDLANDRLIVVEEGAGFRKVHLEVIPIKAPPSGVRCFLVLFHEPSAPEPPAAPTSESPADDARHVAAEQLVQQPCLLRRVRSPEKLTDHLFHRRRLVGAKRLELA